MLTMDKARFKSNRFIVLLINFLILCFNILALYYLFVVILIITIFILGNNHKKARPQNAP